MILYDWPKIKKAANKKAGNILLIIHILTFNLPPVNRKDPSFRYYGKNWSGSSFLANPEQIFLDRRKYTDLELAQYIGFASLRNYAEYKATQKTTLDFLICKGKEELINKNRLLRVENDQVYFLFEEVAKEKK